MDHVTSQFKTLQLPTNIWLRTFECVIALQSKFLFYGTTFRALHKPQLSNLSSILFFFWSLLLFSCGFQPPPVTRQPRWFSSIVTWTCHPVLCLKDLVRVVHSIWKDTPNPSAGSTSSWLLSSSIIFSAILILTWLSWAEAVVPSFVSFYTLLCYCIYRCFSFTCLWFRISE